MTSTTHNHHQPKAYARDAGLRLGKLISVIKQDLPESVKVELRKLYLMVVNLNDSASLHKMVKELNCHRYKTGSSFQILETYTKKHGKTLEIREERF